MARARKKTKRARKRPAKRRNASQDGSSWTLGVAILGITLLLGAAAYMISVNDEARTTVAGIVERMTPELPDTVKQFPDQVRQQLPEVPSLTKNTPAE
jgi:hypothetical protein